MSEWYWDNPNLDAYASALEACWEFEEPAGEITDLVHGHTSSSHVDTILYQRTGRHGDCVQFIGSDAAFVFDPGPICDFYGSDWTVAFWFMTYDIGGSAYPVITIEREGGADYTRVVALVPSVYTACVRWMTDDGPGPTETYWGIDPPAPDEPLVWHHVAIRREGGFLTAFFDGVNLDAHTPTDIIPSSPTILKIQFSGYATGESRYLDQVVVWSDAISDSAIAALAAGAYLSPVVTTLRMRPLVVPGVRARHRPRGLRTSHPFQHAAQVNIPEVPGYQLAARVAPGVRVRHRPRVIQTSHPFQHAAQPPPPAALPNHIMPRMLRGVRMRHTPRSQVIGHPSRYPPLGYTVPLIMPQVVRGVRTPHPTHSRRVSPHMIHYSRWYADFGARYRIFDDAEYRIYRSNTGPPSDDDEPFATTAALPHTPDGIFPADTWYVSVSYFDGVLDSGFLPIGSGGETYLWLDISDGVFDLPPHAPQLWRLEQRANGVVRIVGVYIQPGNLRAAAWSIAYTVNGSTPPADTPDVTVDVPAVGLAVLAYDLPAQSHGTTVKVRLQVRRNDGTDEVPNWVYSEGSTVETTTADATGPSVPLAADRWAGRLPEDM